MHAHDLRRLLTSEGQAALALARELGELAPLARQAALRRRFPAELARAAEELTALRRRAAAKFALAERLYFPSSDALEQATPEAVARHQAARYAGHRLVLDLGCGAGGDALALAAVAEVIALDRLEVNVLAARENLRAAGLLSHARLAVADVTRLRLPPPRPPDPAHGGAPAPAGLTPSRGVAPPVTLTRPSGSPAPAGLTPSRAPCLQVPDPVHHTRPDLAGAARPRVPGGADALYLDPARRAGGQRVFDPEAYAPPLSFVAELVATGIDAGVKVAPGIDWRRLPFDCEVELISLDGDVRTAVLWANGLRSTARRATLLPTGVTLALDGPEPAVPIGPIRRYLYEPDGAVIRAGLVRPLAAQLGATLIDPNIAYLTADAPIETPFARRLRIDEVLPFSQKRIAARLRQLGVGRPVVKKRGSPLDPERFADLVRGPGDRSATLVLTRIAGRPWAILCEVDGPHPLAPSPTRGGGSSAGRG